MIHVSEEINRGLDFLAEREISCQLQREQKHSIRQLKGKKIVEVVAGAYSSLVLKQFACSKVSFTGEGGGGRGEENQIGSYKICSVYCHSIYGIPKAVSFKVQKWDNKVI